MLRYRLLALDVDGTLVNSRDELTPPTRHALAEAAGAGIRVVLATGRRYSRTLHLVEPLGIDVPLITASGALVKDPLDHRTLYCAEFAADVLHRTLATIDAAGYEPVALADTFCEGFDFYKPQAHAKSAELAEYLDRNVDCSRIWPGLVADPPPGVFQVFAMGTHVQMLDLQKTVERDLPGKLNTHVLRSPKYSGYLCEITPAGVTKWSGVERLAALWGIPDVAICAVGDDVNDIPMIQGAGLGIAMGNALPAVKAVADYVVPSHDEDGLVHVVQRLLEEG